MSEDLKDMTDFDISALMNMFPDAKLTIKDRIPTPLLLFYLSLIHISEPTRPY